MFADMPAETRTHHWPEPFIDVTSVAETQLSMVAQPAWWHNYTSVQQQAHCSNNLPNTQTQQLLLATVQAMFSSPPPTGTIHCLALNSSNKAGALLTTIST
jgi:hypothetical protein